MSWGQRKAVHLTCIDCHNALGSSRNTTSALSTIGVRQPYAPRNSKSAHQLTQNT